MRRRRARFRAGLLATLVLATGGLITASPALFAAGAIPLAFVAYEAASSVGEPAALLTVERECTPATPVPGERVRVRLAVRNESGRTLPDVRIADGAPSGPRILEGDSVAAGALRPGEELVASYALRPVRGTYEFDDPVVRLRSLGGGAVATDVLPASGTDRVECRTHLEEVPVRRRTRRVGGTVPSDSGGAGFEFYATREYRSGDPLNRVDWRRFAKTGSLGTVEFREHRASQVVVIADGRDAARVRAAAGLPDAATLSAYAAVRIASTVREANHDVGLAALGVEGHEPGVVPGPPAYVEPSTDVGTAERILRVCDRIAAADAAAGAMETADASSTAAAAERSGAEPATVVDDSSTPVADGSGATDAGSGHSGNHDSGSGHSGNRDTVNGDSGNHDSGEASGRPEPPDPPDPAGAEAASRLLALLPPDAQVVVCSPVLDDGAATVIRELRGGGVPVTLCSPDVTGAGSDRASDGARLRGVQRGIALATLRREGVAVVDWDPEEPLRVALEGRLAEVLG